MNGQLDLTGYDLANLDLNSVERVEILKGPQSTLWLGCDGGVINIITTKSETLVVHSERKRRHGSEYTTAGISGGTEKQPTASLTPITAMRFSSLKNNEETDALDVTSLLVSMVHFPNRQKDMPACDTSMPSANMIMLLVSITTNTIMIKSS